jgi:xanthine dehydrogenase accessory factor
VLPRGFLHGVRREAELRRIRRRTSVHDRRRQFAQVAAADLDGHGELTPDVFEGAVVEVATEVLATGVPQLVTYGISDEQALSVGLTCGGTIEVFVRPVVPEVLDLGLVAERIGRDAPVAIATVVAHAGDPTVVGTSLVVTDGGEVLGATGVDDLDHAIVEAARGLLDSGSCEVRHLGPNGERRMDDVAVLVEPFAPRPRMIVFGAIDFAAAVASVGAFLGYEVTVCDARARFATAARFPDAHEIVVEWPHRYLASTHVDARTAICVLTHDPKFDVPVLEVALTTDVGYIGVMGSRRTHEDRLERLRAIGVTEEQLARLRSPIGLDLGARTPQETAVSIAAELVLERHGGSGGRLTDIDGPIHRDPLPATAPGT